jgi:hypothetical protein
MTERDSSARRVGMSEAALDEALASWPMPERDAMEWDEAAARVEDRILAGGAPGEMSALLSDDEIFAAPLPAAHDEIGGPDSVPPEQPVSISSRSVRPRRSFKDLADLAKSAPPPSALIEPVLIETGVGVEAGIAAAAAVEVEGEIAAAADAPRAVAAVPQASTGVVVPIGDAKAKPPVEKQKRSGLLIANVIGALAIAAAAVFFVRSRHAEPPPAPVAQTPPPATATPVAAKATAAAPHDDAIDPMALPLVSAPTATMTGVLPMAPATALAPVAIASGPPSASASAAPSSDPAATVASAAPSSSATLEDQMRQAAGPSVSATGEPPAAADTSTGPIGNVPMKPSQGVVSGALGAVMPAARACLDADDPVSHATVVFRSDGSVKSVSIEGGIAGKPQEACVRAALMKARVPPFAQPDFMGFATIRPN